MSADDCAAVLARLYAFLDGECPEAEADEIRHHLDACDHCVEDADVAVALKALVHRCCRTAAAPDELRSRLMAQYSVTSRTTYTRVEVTQVRVVPPGQA